MVDEAHLIDDPSTFEALRALLNFATLGPPDLMLLLVGGPELLLRLPAGLADRLTARCLLGPLSESETASYVHGRLASAGRPRTAVHRRGLHTLHRASDGLPRRLNRLADLALLVAYADGLPRPDARAIAVAVREADPGSVRRLTGSRIAGRGVVPAETVSIHLALEDRIVGGCLTVYHVRKR